MSYIVDPGPKRVKLTRFKPPGHDVHVKFSAFRDVAQTRRLKDRVDSLIAAKLNSDPPPKELSAWIDNMPERIASRLIERGLLDRRRTERAKPIDLHIYDYERAVQARRGNTISHAKAMAAQAATSARR